MKKYGLSFRQNAVLSLSDLKKDGILKVGNIEIKNVRDLCGYLDISSNTLYRWQKEFSGLKSEKKDTFDNSGEKIENGERIKFKEKMKKAYENGGDIHESESDLMSNSATDDDFDDIHYTKETRIATKGDKKIGNGKYKQFKTTDAEKKAYGKRVENEIKGFLELPVQDKKKTPGKKSTGDQKEIFGIRYYAWFARNLGVKGYYNMVLAQLKATIGLELIEQSGLIDMKKGIAKIDWLHEIGWVKK